MKKTLLRDTPHELNVSFKNGVGFVIQIITDGKINQQGVVKVRDDIKRKVHELLNREDPRPVQQQVSHLKKHLGSEFIP